MGLFALLLVGLVIVIRLVLAKYFLSDLAGEKFSFGLVIRRFLVALLLTLLVMAVVGGAIYLLYRGEYIQGPIIPLVGTLIVVVASVWIYSRTLRKFVHTRRKVVRVYLRDYGVAMMISMLMTLISLVVMLFQTMGSDILDSIIPGATPATASYIDGVPGSSVPGVGSIGGVRDSVDVPRQDSTDEPQTADDMIDVMDEAIDIDEVTTTSDITDAQTQERDRLRSRTYESEEDAANITEYVETHYPDATPRDDMLETCQESLFLGKTDDGMIGVMMYHTYDEMVYAVDVFSSHSDGTRSKEAHEFSTRDRGNLTIQQVITRALDTYNLETLNKKETDMTTKALCGRIVYDDQGTIRSWTIANGQLIGEPDGMVEIAQEPADDEMNGFSVNESASPVEFVEVAGVE